MAERRDFSRGKEMKTRQYMIYFFMVWGVGGGEAPA